SLVKVAVLSKKQTDNDLSLLVDNNTVMDVSELERNGPGGAQGGKRVKLPFYNSGGSSDCPGSEGDQPCKEDLRKRRRGDRAFSTDRGHLIRLSSHGCSSTRTTSLLTVISCGTMRTFYGRRK
ncbi:hypothetical protein CRENBAI_006239, partial [Crenichthys baileyi]